MFFPKILIGDYEEDIFIDKPRKKKRGEIIHFVLSNIITYTDLHKIDDIVIWALSYFGERKEKWDINREFILPIQEIFNNPELEYVFNQKRVYIEQEILVPKTEGFKIIRPDRIVVTEKKSTVVEFKSEFISSTYGKHLAQVKEYMSVIKKIFNKYSSGLLIYVLSNKVISIE